MHTARWHPLKPNIQNCVNFFVCQPFRKSTRTTLRFEKHLLPFSQNQDGILRNPMFKTVNFFYPSLVRCSSVDININFYPAISFLIHMAQTASNAALLWLSIHKSGSVDGLQAFSLERNFFKKLSQELR